METKLDKLGMILSIGCMIHCMLMPIMLPLLPAIGFAFGHDYQFHLVLAFIIGAIAIVALIFGHRKHGMGTPFVIAIPGIILLFAMAYSEYLGVNSAIVTIVTVEGSLLIAVAHYFNHKYLCACKHHGKHSCH